MSSRFVTQDTGEKIPILVLAPEGKFRVALEGLLSVAGFLPLARLEEGQDPYAAIVVDFGAPLSGVYSKLQAINAHCKIFLVSFDDSRLEEVRLRIPRVIELRYLSVIALTSEPLSELDRLLRSVIWDEDVKPDGGSCSPLWFEDVCEHIVHELLSSRPKSGVYSGGIDEEFTRVIADARLKLDLRPGREEKRFNLQKLVGVKIQGRGYQELLGQLVSALELSRPKAIASPEILPEILLPKAQVTKARILKSPSINIKSSKKLKRQIGLGLIGASCFLGILVGGTYALYVFDLHSLTTTLDSLVYQKTVPGKVFSSTKTLTQISRLTFVTHAADLLTSWAKQGKESDLVGALPLVRTGVEGYGELDQARQKLLSAYQASLQGGAGDPIALINSAGSNLDIAYKDFSLLQARIIQDDVLFPEEVGGKSVQAQLTSQLPNLRHDVVSMRSVVGILPALLGDSKPHVYAFALEDSNNLRGSGGSVVAVAVLSFDKGKLVTQQVYPVDTLNKALTGSVIAPDELKNFLHLANWTLSDSTWDASFGKVATQISWFVSKALSRSVDGVLVIPTNSLPGLLEAVGQVHLQASSEDVNSTSYQPIVEEKIAKLALSPELLNTFNSDVFAAIMSRIQQVDAQKAGQFLTYLALSLSNSNAYITVGDQEAQRAFSTLSWDGNPISPVCPSQFSQSQCLASTVFETENSLGENSVGAYIKRSQVHTIRVGSDFLLQNRTITLTNTATALAWPYGDYQVLIKLLVDDAAQIQGLSINDQALTPDKFSLSKEGDKLVVRVVADVPIGSTTRVRVIYTTPGLGSTNGSLVFFEQKQAGTSEDPFTLIVTYPDSFTPKSVAPRADVGQNSLTFIGKHDSNHLYGIGF